MNSGMLFNSLQSLFFFPAVTMLYFWTPHAHRWLLLLVASCVFYMAFIPSYILIPAATIIVDYSAQRSSSNAAKERGEESFS